MMWVASRTQHPHLPDLSISHISRVRMETPLPHRLSRTPAVDALAASLHAAITQRDAALGDIAALQRMLGADKAAGALAHAMREAVIAALYRWQCATLYGLWSINQRATHDALIQQHAAETAAAESALFLEAEESRGAELQSGCFDGGTAFAGERVQASRRA